MSEFNMEFERARKRVIDARKAVQDAAKVFENAVYEFQTKYPNAVIPSAD